MAVETIFQRADLSAPALGINDMLWYFEHKFLNTGPNEVIQNAIER